MLVALIWTIISGVIIFKTLVMSPLSDLGLISIKDEVIAWAFSLSFIPLAVWVAMQRIFKNYWLYSVLFSLMLALLYSFLWDKLSFNEVVIPLSSEGNMGFVAEGMQWSGTEGRFFQSADFDMLSSCLLIAGIAFTANTLRQLRSREINELKLQASLTKSKMSLLKSQIHPHFMFNTLNTVAGLMEDDVDKAQSVLEDFGHLLRTSLRQSEQQFVSLGDELDFIKRYLAIEKVRFGDKIKVKWLIDDSCYEASIPHMLLQPLVENVIKHAFPVHQDQQLLTIKVTKVGQTLSLIVEDNGCGIEPGVSDGVGFETVRERISTLFGEKGGFMIQTLEEGGTRVVISFPFKVYENKEIEIGNAD